MVLRLPFAASKRFLVPATLRSMTKRRITIRSSATVHRALMLPAAISRTLRPHRDELPFETLGEYKLIRKLGEGGMGAVYEAQHQRLEKTVALKLLPRGSFASPESVERFEREIRAIGKLDHPNFVSALDAGKIGDTHYLAMELIHGADLNAILKHQVRLQTADGCELIRQAAAGLVEANRRGIVHRDIKPSNLMLTSWRGRPTVKILDLGLAKLVRGDQDELTSTGQMLGTIDYMSPEQCDESQTVDIRSDVYSLGATLFKLLTGRTPFSSTSSAVRKLRAILTQPAPSVSSNTSEDIPKRTCRADRSNARQGTQRSS